MLVPVKCLLSRLQGVQKSPFRIDAISDRCGLESLPHSVLVFTWEVPGRQCAGGRDGVALTGGSGSHAAKPCVPVPVAPHHDVVHDRYRLRGLA